MNVPSGLQVSNPLHVQWNPPWNPNWINASNVLEYFTNTMNPFYDPNCLNEQIRMQRLSPEVLSRASGVEYALLFACEPLFVIRKQYRQANQTITPMEDYYIIGGTVYQAPDLCSVLNSRLQASIEHLRTAFEEAKSFYRFHPAKGYYWQFRNESTVEKKSKFILKSTVANMLFLDLAAKKSKENVVEDVRASLYQRQRMDTLIGDLVNKFPLPLLEEVGDMDSMEKESPKKAAPADNNFDRTLHRLVVETRRRMDNGHSLQSSCQMYKCLPGRFGLVVELGAAEPCHHRRPNFHMFRSVSERFSAYRFNFLKLCPNEVRYVDNKAAYLHNQSTTTDKTNGDKLFLQILMQINEWPKSNDAQGWHKIIMTTKLRGHKPLLAPFMDKRLPQMLTAEGLRTAVKTLLLSNCRQLALGFNSPLAMCEVNHLHFELLYCPYSSKFSDQSAEKVADGLYVLKEWLLPAIAVQMTAQNLNQFIRQCLLVSNHFVETNQPFNMILGRSPLLDSNGETIDKSLPVTSYFFPRQAVSPISPKTSLCPSAADMRGIVEVYTSTQFQAVSETAIVRIFSEKAALKSHEFDKIVDQLKQRFSSPNQTQTTARRPSVTLSNNQCIHENAAKCFSWCQHERLLSNASSPMSTVESVDKMVMTTTAEANGHLDEVMHQGTDVTSDDSVCNESPRITTGYYLSHTGYTVPSYSPIMHHRPVNIEYVPIHRSGSCQSCCCSSTQFCGQIPQAYAHPMAPCAPIVGGLCTYAASNNVDQSHPQHPPPPTSIMYPSMVPSVFATPYSPACCPHHGPFAASIQPIPFAGCSIDPSNISQQKSHGRVESPLVSTSDTSSMSDASSKMGKVSENELTTKEDELTGNNGGGAAPPEESLPLSVESLHDGTQPISQRYVTGAKLEREHGRTPLFGDTPSWWNQEEVAKCQSKQGDHPIVAQENDQPNSSLPRDEVGVLPEQPSQKKQEKGEEPLGQPEETANTYKASIRMDIPFAPVLTGKANHNNSGKENCHSSESHRTAAFTIQFNEDHSTNMVAIEKESTRSYQRLHMPRGKPSTTKMKVPKPKPVEEEVPTKASVNEAVDDDAVSECGTYTVDDDCSYAKNQQLYDVETAGDGADDRNALLKELIKISSGEKQQKVGAKQCVTTSKSGPSSPITRRTNSASQIVHTTKGAVGGQTAAQNFRRSDGGRFSMRSKVTMSPGRTIGGGSSKNYANKGQEVRPETLAWLRRKEYNPLKSAGAPSTRGSTSSDTRILNKHERPVGKFERESEYSNFSRSKSFHASTHRSSTPNRRQDSTTTKEGAKSVVSSPSSLRGQVFVQLGSLKRIQMLSVDLMTSASGLKEKIRDSVGQLDDVEEDGNEVTSTPSAECPCPLSDVIKKLTVVDKTLKVTHRMVNQMLSQSKSPIVGNESTV
ncbi:MED6 mediator sub complex component [Trichuris suis]|nr:MED6 mediator sub complex component [Trichuris suis]